MPSPLSYLNEQKDADYYDITANYYPVDTAIAIRDQNSTSLQLTVMNDRPQGGSADITDKATIELM
jgi:hypothetical protein